MSTKTATLSQTKRRGHAARRLWPVLVAIILVLIAAASAWLVLRGKAPVSTEAPEAQRVLDVQATMPFQILIPSYLPKGFDRAGMTVDVNQSGPGGEPMVMLTYRTPKGATLYIKEWVPVNPDKEVLASSRPAQTKWGQGWFLRQGEGLIAMWIDVGPLRASIYTINQDVLPQEELLVVADTMGPASNRQVFDFVVNPPQIQAVAPPPPFEAPINSEGVQEIDLIVTPGGYSPLRFAVKKDVPVKLTFRQLGQVGCGNELNFPVSPENRVSLTLKSPTDKQVLEFTPTQAGEFQFFCSHWMYKGLMTVR